MQNVIEVTHGKKKSPAYISDEATYLRRSTEIIASEATCREALFPTLDQQQNRLRFDKPEDIITLNDQQITFHAQYGTFVASTKNLAAAALAMSITEQETAEYARVVLMHIQHMSFRSKSISFRCTAISPQRT